MTRQHLDDVLDALTEIGRAESRLDDASIQQMAAAASAAARGLDEPVTVSAGSQVETRPAHRFSLLAVAAAAVVILGVTLGVLSRSNQQIATDTGVLSLDQPPIDSPGPADDEPAPPTSQGDAPLIIEAETTVPSTSTTTATDTGDLSTSSTVGTATPSSAGPSSMPPQPEGSTSTEAGSDSPATTASASPSSEAGQAPAEGMTIVVGGAGSVAFTMDDGQPVVSAVSDAPGWSHEVDQPAIGELVVSFVGADDTASLRIWSTDQRFVLEVTPDSDHWVGRTSTRTITYETAGSVVVHHGADGIMGLDVAAEGYWTARVAVVGRQHVDVRFVGPDGVRADGYDLGIGSQRLTIGVGS